MGNSRLHITSFGSTTSAGLACWKAGAKYSSAVLGES